MRVMRVLPASLLLAALSPPAYALTTNDLSQGVTASDLVRTLFGTSPITFSNVQYNGAPAAAGLFADGEVVGMSGGMILSTGNIADAAGPNLSTGKSTQFGGSGDTRLDALAGAPTRDAAMLDFDFVTPGGSLGLDFVFASEEYNEFVASQFNDAFAVFLDGQNIALVPGTTQPVNSRSINLNTQADLFRNNDIGAGAPHNLEFDGFTGVLRATANLTPGTHHLSVVIADANDDKFDSAVLMRTGGFSVSSPVAQPPENVPTLSEWVMLVLGGMLLWLGAQRLRKHSA